MAAHIINAMSEFVSDLYPLVHAELTDDNKEYINQKCKMLHFALGHAKFGELLESDHWQILYYSLECNAFKAVIYFWWMIQDHYYQEFYRFDSPKTAEIWFERKYKG